MIKESEKKKKAQDIILAIVIFLLLVAAMFSFKKLPQNNTVSQLEPSRAIYKLMATPILITITPINSLWKVYSGETDYTQDGSSQFSIQYPSTWENEKSILYPFGKGNNDQNTPMILLGAGGHEGPGSDEKRQFPAGEAYYYWKVQPKGHVFAYATVIKGNKTYIFEVRNLPGDKSKEYEEIFNTMLKTLVIY